MYCPPYVLPAFERQCADARKVFARRWAQWCKGLVACAPAAAAGPRLTAAARADQRGQLFAVGDVELDAGAVEVALHGAHRHHQPVGDLPVAEPRARPDSRSRVRASSAAAGARRCPVRACGYRRIRRRGGWRPRPLPPCAAGRRTPRTRPPPARPRRPPTAVRRSPRIAAAAAKIAAASRSRSAAACAAMTAASRPPTPVAMSTSAVQAGLVTEPDRVVQRQHFDRPLSGLFGAAEPRPAPNRLRR